MLNILSTLVDHLPVGVVVLDAEGRAVLFNRVEELLSGRRREAVIGTDFFRSHGVCMNVPDFGGRLDECLRQGLRLEADFSFPFPLLATPREVRAQLSGFEANGLPFGLLVVRDVSHERSVAMMRETLSQALVHDLKNPLAGVVASLSYVSSFVRDTEDAREAVQDGVAAAARMERLLVNLLDTSRLETAEFPSRCTSSTYGCSRSAWWPSSGRWSARAS